MPAEGGGAEPLWSDDPVSRGQLTHLFSGPIQMDATFGGLTVNETILPDTDPQLAVSGALSTAPMPGAGQVVYQNGLLWQGPIPVTISGQLANPITFEFPGGGEEEAAEGEMAGAMGGGGGEMAAAGSGEDEEDLEE
jgi:hypothetical protein